jgi:DNA-binding NarL/FixJ family response regulator
VLWRLQEGAKPDMIASELGLAEPMVKEYIKAILRKVRTDRIDLSVDC